MIKPLVGADTIRPHNSSTADRAIPPSELRINPSVNALRRCHHRTGARPLCRCATSPRTAGSHPLQGRLIIHNTAPLVFIKGSCRIFATEGIKAGGRLPPLRRHYCNRLAVGADTIRPRVHVGIGSYKEIKAKRILSRTHKKPPGPFGPGGSLSYGKRKIICRFDTTQRYLRWYCLHTRYGRSAPRSGRRWPTGYP